MCLHHPRLISLSLTNPSFVLASTQELHEKISVLCNRVRDLEDSLRHSHSLVSPDRHPLLAEDLLQIKAPLQREPPTHRNVPRGDVKEEEQNGEFVDAFGSLSINASGGAKYFGSIANSWVSQLIGHKGACFIHNLRSFSLSLVLFAGNCSIRISPRDRSNLTSERRLGRSGIRGRQVSLFTEYSFTRDFGAEWCLPACSELSSAPGRKCPTARAFLVSSRIAQSPLPLPGLLLTRCLDVSDLDSRDRPHSDIVSGTTQSTSRISSRKYTRYFMHRTPLPHPMTHYFLTSSPSCSWFLQSEAWWISNTQPTISRPRNTTNWHVLRYSRVPSSRILLSAPYRHWHVPPSCCSNWMLIFSLIVPYDLFPFLLRQTRI